MTITATVQSSTITLKAEIDEQPDGGYRVRAHDGGDEWITTEFGTFPAAWDYVAEWFRGRVVV